ncbi:hypothetical protein [Longispora urticae]
MGTEALAADLRLLGLAPADADAYVALLRTDNDPPTGTDTRLLDLGLANRVAQHLEPVPPTVALDLLTHRREADLAGARIAVRNAYAAGPQADGCGTVEVLSGPVMRARIKDAERNAVRLVRMLDSPPHYAASTPNREQLANLDRGVDYQVVYAAASLTLPGYLAGNIIPAAEHGERARMLDALPVKVSIFDDEVAYVGHTLQDTAAMRSMTRVGPGSLLTGLIGLVEQCWALGLAFYRRDSPLRADERRLLALLVADASDERIAVELGIGRRTLYHRLEVLMTRAGAANRFQLAVAAVDLGWL